MSYIEKNLMSAEKIVYRTKLHRIGSSGEGQVLEYNISGTLLKNIVTQDLILDILFQELEVDKIL